MVGTQVAPGLPHRSRWGELHVLRLEGEVDAHAGGEADHRPALPSRRVSEGGREGSLAGIGDDDADSALQLDAHLAFARLADLNEGHVSDAPGVWGWIMTTSSEATAGKEAPRNLGRVAFTQLTHKDS